MDGGREDESNSFRFLGESEVMDGRFIDTRIHSRVPATSGCLFLLIGAPPLKFKLVPGR